MLSVMEGTTLSLLPYPHAYTIFFFLDINNYHPVTLTHSTLEMLSLCYNTQ